MEKKNKKKGAGGTSRAVIIVSDNALYIFWQRGHNDCLETSIIFFRRIETMRAPVKLTKKTKNTSALGRDHVTRQVKNETEKRELIKIHM